MARPSAADRRRALTEAKGARGGRLSPPPVRPPGRETPPPPSRSASGGGGGGRPSERPGSGSLASAERERAVTETELPGFLAKLTMRSQDILDNSSRATVNFFQRIGGKRKAGRGV